MKNKAKNLAVNQYATPEERASIYDPATGKVNWQNNPDLDKIEMAVATRKSDQTGALTHVKKLSDALSALTLAGVKLPADVKANLIPDITAQLKQGAGAPSATATANAP